MSWKDIIKIKTDDGNYLIVKDVEKFKRALRSHLRQVGLLFYGTSEKTKFRASHIYIADKWLETDYNTRLEIYASVRNPKGTSREPVITTLEENEEGDFIFLTVMGAGINLGGNSIINSEKELIEAIGQGVERDLQGE
jgi:hypothetical protein